MSEVSLAVGGRTYTLRCEDGQEDHVRKLAAVIDAKLSDMGTNLSSMEAKNLLFAALLLADELDEAKRGGGAPAPSPDGANGSDAVAEKLETLADRLEKTAQALESGVDAS